MEKEGNIFGRWKQAVLNTPAERLLRVNMHGYFLQTFGLGFVSIMLLFNATWKWLIFAFVFSMWNTVSGFISSYQQYTQIVTMKKELGIPEEEEKSPHRKKVKFIKDTMGEMTGLICLLISVIISALIINPLNAIAYMLILFMVIVGLFYYLTFFIIAYRIAKFKKEKQNGSTTNT